jgi:hypothetical protein
MRGVHSLHPGWPFIVFSWGMFNFGMNSGTNAFAQHWLFWQHALPIFNEATNPSGTITHSYVNYAVNGIAVALGFVVAVKRLWWGLYLGRRSYREYLLALCCTTVKGHVILLAHTSLCSLNHRALR